MSLDSGGGLTSKIEKSSIIDALTVLVLAYASYVMYVDLGFNQDLLAVSTDPDIIAIQAMLFLIGVHALEFLIDMKSDGGGLH